VIGAKSAYMTEGILAGGKPREIPARWW